MGEKERLLELLKDIPCIDTEKLADYLICNDVIVQSRGEWDDVMCSICHEQAPMRVSGTMFSRSLVPYKSKYCPHCGAKMVGV